MTVLTFERVSCAVYDNMTVVVEIDEDGEQRIVGGDETTSDCLKAFRPDPEWTEENLLYSAEHVREIGVEVDASYDFVISGDIL